MKLSNFALQVLVSLDVRFIVQTCSLLPQLAFPDFDPWGKRGRCGIQVYELWSFPTRSSNLRNILQQIGHSLPRRGIMTHPHDDTSQKRRRTSSAKRSRQTQNAHESLSSRFIFKDWETSVCIFRVSSGWLSSILARNASRTQRS